MFLTTLHLLLLLAAFSPGTNQSRQPTPDLFQNDLEPRLNKDNSRIHSDIGEWCQDNEDKARTLLNNITSAIISKDRDMIGHNIHPDFVFENCNGYKKLFDYERDYILDMVSRAWQPVFVIIDRIHDCGDVCDVIIYGAVMHPIKARLRLDLHSEYVKHAEDRTCNDILSVLSQA